MKLLVCGTRKKGYEKIVYRELSAYNFKGSAEIIEGCCPDSADEYAEKWAKETGIKVHHFPGNPGNYLKRNIEMVEMADAVLAFWDDFSYGTAHSIAHAVKKGIPVKVIHI